MNELDGIEPANSISQLEIEILKLGRTIMWSLAVIAVCVFGTVAVKAYVGVHSVEFCI
jgi:hypothetical protein